MENNNRDCKENKIPKILGKMEEMKNGWNGTKKKRDRIEKILFKTGKKFICLQNSEVLLIKML